jgi:hypothetical protein
MPSVDLPPLPRTRPRQRAPLSVVPRGRFPGAHGRAGEWEVPTIPNATDYVTFTREFQQLTDEMAKKAREKNIDGAALAYLRLTMNCVSCHKYVREVSK